MNHCHDAILALKRCLFYAMLGLAVLCSGCLCTQGLIAENHKYNVNRHQVTARKCSISEEKKALVISFDVEVSHNSVKKSKGPSRITHYKTNKNYPIGKIPQNVVRCKLGIVPDSAIKREELEKKDLNILGPDSESGDAEPHLYLPVFYSDNIHFSSYPDPPAKGFPPIHVHPLDLKQLEKPFFLKSRGGNYKLVIPYKHSESSVYVYSPKDGFFHGEASDTLCAFDRPRIQTFLFDLVYLPVGLVLDTIFFPAEIFIVQLMRY